MKDDRITPWQEELILYAASQFHQWRLTNLQDWMMAQGINYALSLCTKKQAWAILRCMCDPELGVKHD